MPDTPIEIQTTSTPDSAVIWLHGLGADGNDFVPIVSELNLPDSLGIRFIFPHAPHRPVTCNGGYVMRAWYDIYSLENIEQEDLAGLTESRQYIESLIQDEIDRGIQPGRIILMGFSQGGAVALHAGLRHTDTLAGIGALSTYLPFRDSLDTDKNAANQNTPIFMAHGQYDPVVRFDLGDRSCQLLRQSGYDIDWHDYSMEHSVCMEEISDISDWLKRLLTN